jgi:hypothetical protein
MKVDRSSRNLTVSISLLSTHNWSAASNTTWQNVLLLYLQNTENSPASHYTVEGEIKLPDNIDEWQ